MVAACGALPVAPEQAEVEVPGGGRRRAACDGLAGVVAQEDGGEPRRRSEALLRGAEGEVDIRSVDGDFHAAEGGYGVDQEQGAVPVGEVGQLVQGLEDTGGGLSVHDGEHLDLGVALQLRLDRIEVDGGSPLLLDLGDRRAVAAGDVGQAFAEEAVRGRDDDVAGLEQVGHSGLHAGVAGAGEGEGEAVLCAEDLAEHASRVVHDLDEVGVEMAEDGGGHGPEDAGVDVGRPCAQQQARRRVQLGYGLRDHDYLPYAGRLISQPKQPSRRPRVRQPSEAPPERRGIDWQRPEGAAILGAAGGAPCQELNATFPCSPWATLSCFPTCR